MHVLVLLVVRVARLPLRLDGFLVEHDQFVDALVPVIRIGVRFARQSKIDSRPVGKVNDDRAVSINRTGYQEAANRANARVVPVGKGAALDPVDPALQSMDKRGAIPCSLSVFGPDQPDGRWHLVLETELGDPYRIGRHFTRLLGGQWLSGHNEKPRPEAGDEKGLDQSRHVRDPFRMAVQITLAAVFRVITLARIIHEVDYCGTTRACPGLDPGPCTRGV